MKPKPPLSDEAIAQHAYDAGFRGQNLVTAVAVAIGESDGVPNARGDETLQDSKWGTSIGLWQIRSLHADRGTGRQRDALANLNPRTNARHAYEIWKERGNFSAWSVYNDGLHLQHMDRARAAVQHVGSGNRPSGERGGGQRAGRRIVMSLRELAEFESLMDTSRNRVARSLGNVQDIACDLRLAGSTQPHASYLNSLFDAATGQYGLPLVVRHLDWETGLIQRIRKLADAVDGDNRRLGPEDLMLFLNNANGRAGLPEAAVLEALIAGGMRAQGAPPRPREHHRPRVPDNLAPQQMNHGNIVPPGLRRYANGYLPASKLVNVGEGEKLAAVAAKHFHRMDAAARAYGTDLRVSSGYRTFAQQNYWYELFRSGRGELAAPPGSSNHGWGLSVDLDVNGDSLRWLRENAAKYGFFNDVPSEPWHWTYRPL